MSYDYSLFVPPGPGPMSSWTAAPLMPLGTLEEVERALTVRRITRRQVGELCRMLGVVAVDSQKVELIRPWHDGEQG